MGHTALGEEHVVVLAAVEGRVEVDEVDGFVLDVLAQDFEAVAVIELVFLHRGKIVARTGRLRNCWSVCVLKISRSIWSGERCQKRPAPRERLLTIGRKGR